MENNKNSQYLKLIRTQERIIKELKQTNWMYFLAGLSVGFFLTSLIFFIKINIWKQ